MIGLILLISVLTFGSAHQIVPVERNADGFCIRGDGNPGYCVDSDNCSYIFNILKRHNEKKHIEQHEINYIQNSRCNPNRKGYVCCESETAKQYLLKGIQELSAIECGIFSEPKVTKGKEVTLMSRPWMALLKLRNDGLGEFGCAGTIINKRFILTAAHCCIEDQLLSVRLGEHNITSNIEDCGNVKGRWTCAPPVQDFDVERVFIHGNYSPLTKHNDIALVKLKSDINLSLNSTKPICLPVTETLQQKAENMKIFLVSGWGRTEKGIKSQVLMETNIPRKKRGTCQLSFREIIVETQICAGDIQYDSCDGDSGGPLMYPAIFNGKQLFVQFGIVTFGSTKCAQIYPGVYTKVGSFMNWIAYTLGTN